jgi:hypothetical protein
MTVIGWIAMYPVHFAAVHMVLLALPLLLRPGTLVQSLRAIGRLFHPIAWSSRWHYFGFALAAFIPLSHLIGAVLLPQVNGDAVSLHLAVPSIVAIDRFWAFDVKRAIYAVMPMGVSWMMLPAYLLGGELAARLVNFCFFLATVLLLFCVMRRYLGAGTAWMLTGLYASTPLFLAENGNIYADNLWAALLFGAAVSLARFRETRLEPYFWIAVTLAAASLSVKIIGAVLVLALALFAARESLDRPSRFAWAFGIFAAIGAYPYAYAFFKTGNPVFPFMNHIFKSPLYADAAFLGLNRPMFTSLYELTFRTGSYIDGGGTNGALGFHYLALLPLSVLALTRKYPYLGVVSLVGAVVFVASASFFAEPNLRYLYPALALLMVPVAIAYAQARELSKTLYVVLCGFGCTMTAVNAYAMPLSAPTHREFPLATVFGRFGIDEYRDWAAPERRLIEYLNMTRGSAVRVAIFARPNIVELKGAWVFGNFYDYLFTTQKLAKARSADEVFRLMREERITKFMAFKPGRGNINLSAVVDQFLAKYTEPEFEAGDAYLSRYKPEWRFSEEVVANGDFIDRLSGWHHSDPSIHDPAAGTISLKGADAVHQKVGIDERVVYRYVVTARCADPGSRLRAWLNWSDGQQRHINTFESPMNCDATFKTIAAEVSPPRGAQFAELVVAASGNGQRVEVSRVSLKW